MKLYFLQEEDIGLPTQIFLGILILAVAITIYYFLNRWVFALKRQLWNQRQQINILIKIAEKLGVTDDFKDILVRNNNKDDEYIKL